MGAGIGPAGPRIDIESVCGPFFYFPEVVKTELFGRRVLYSDEIEVNAGNVLRVWDSVQSDHRSNRSEINTLYDYYRGKQDILGRVKTIRPEICNRIVENRANEIVSFKVGYLCGEPIQYISRSGEDKVSRDIGTLNDMMLADSKATKDKELLEWQMIAGTAYRLVLVADDGSEAPFELHTLDPRNTYIIRSSRVGHKVLAAGTYVIDRKGHEIHSIYTPKMFFEVKGGKILRVEPHGIGRVPIIEYPANNARLGAFEPVVPILDAINTVSSNRLDGVEQFVQSMMKFINCEVDQDTIQELAQLGAIQIKSTDGQNADVELMTQELNQQQTQVLMDHMYQTVLTICGMPNRNGNGSSTSDTGAASLLRDGWTLAEARAKDSELMFKRSENEMLKVVLPICKALGGIDLSLRDVETKFTRRNYENIQTKAQVLCEMLNNQKIDPRLAFSHCGMFTDAEEAYQMSMKWYEQQKAEQEKQAQEQQKQVETGGDEPNDKPTEKS